MEKSPTPYISNKAMALAVIAALISLGSLMLDFWPSKKTPQAEIASASPSPSLTTSPTPRPTRESQSEPAQKSRPSPTPNLEQEVRRLEEQLGQIKQELEPKSQRPRPTPTPDYPYRPTYKSPDDYPYRHQPTLESPNEGAVFSHQYSSGQMVFRWRSNTASEAVKYRVRIERALAFRLGWKYWDVDVDANQNWYAMQFADLGTYRWHITPVFPDGV